MKRAVLVGTILLGSAGVAVALTNEQANEIKEAVLHNSLPALTVPCGIVDNGRSSYQRLSPITQMSCALALRIIVDDFVARGYMGRSICPPAGTEYGALFDKITNHIVEQRPIWTERAVDVALFALMRVYPCHFDPPIGHRIE